RCDFPMRPIASTAARSTCQPTATRTNQRPRAVPFRKAIPRFRPTSPPATRAQDRNAAPDRLRIDCRVSAAFCGNAWAEGYTDTANQQNVTATLNHNASDTAMSHENIEQDLFLKCLLEANVDGIIAFDREFRYTTWNRAMETISGVKREEVLGKCAFDLFS